MRLNKLPGAAYDHRWFHRWIGAIGNTAFVVGSVLFLYPHLQTIGTWVFIIASSGMMIDSFGEKLVRYDTEHLTAPLPSADGRS
jgi:hypothetical protein